MLNECMDVFKKLYALEGDDFLLENYVPDEGVYMLYEINHNDFLKKAEVFLKFNKHDQDMEGRENIYYEDFLFYDYYSQTINNKPLEKSKKILSNNYLSFFIKNDKLKKEEITEEIIDSYYQHLKEPLLKYGNKKDSKKLYVNVENEIGKPNEELIIKIQSWIKKNLYSLTKDIQTKKYIKIFFCFPDEEQTRELYLNENKRYLIPNIYNKNIYNKSINGTIYGLPNYSMMMNKDKPYLENKDRKISLPILLDIETALLEKKLFDYLLSFNMKGKKHIYFLLDEPNIIAINDNKNNFSVKNAIYIRTEREKSGLKIKDCKYISSYHSELNRIFEFKNVLCLSPYSESDKIINLYGGYKKKVDIENIINRVCFHGYLKTNYDTDDINITKMYSGFSDLLRKTRKLMFDWFYLKDQIHLDTFVYQDILTMIEKERESGHIFSAKHLLNLRISLIDYINENKEEEEKKNTVYSKLEQYLNNHNTEWLFENDDEYYFGVGQLTSYLISKSKSKNVTMDLARPILSSKSDRNIKDEIVRLLKRYGYNEILDNRTRFAQLLRAVSTYVPNTSINMPMIISGMLYDSLIYKKKEKGENEHE